MIKEEKDIIKDYIRLLEGIANKVSNSTRKENDRVDIVPIAKEIGLNLEECMREVERVCATKHYKVGAHIWCTQHNVLPEYKKNGTLILDRDHIEGLYKILAVDLGLRDDY